ncbi:MAG: hypothetical protein QNK92_04995 [Amylibacter sp.]
MALDKKQIEAISGHIRQAKKVRFIIGAGASKSAGIPIPDDMIAMVKANFGHCLYGLLDDQLKDYGAVMGRLSPAERKDFIEPLLEAAGINWGQISLASMIKQEAVSLILTFNFDLIMEKAASLLGMQLPVYDFATAPTDSVT